MQDLLVETGACENRRGQEQQEINPPQTGRKLMMIERKCPRGGEGKGLERMEVKRSKLKMKIRGEVRGVSETGKCHRKGKG